MLRLFLCLGFVLIWGALPVAGQADAGNPFQAWILPRDGTAHTQGYLSELRDSSVTLLRSLEADVSPAIFPVPGIESLQFRRKGQVAKGVILGAVVGLIAGYAIGYSSAESDCSSFLCFDEETQGRMTGLLVGMPIGIAIGATWGSSKKKIHIGGSQQRYQERRVELERFQLR